MANRNHPALAIVTDNRLEALGIRELVLRARPKAQVRIFRHPEDYLAETVGEADIIYIDSGLLAVFGDRFRGRRVQVVPVVASSVAGADPLSPTPDTRLFLSPEWSEETLQRVILKSFDLDREQKEKESEKGLSHRETDVLKEVARGLTNKEIADKLNISMNTVMTHRKNITAKLNIKTVSGLTFYALMNNLISGDEVVNKAAEKPLSD